MASTLSNIIEAATALFARRGAEGVTVLDIAKPGYFVRHDDLSL